MQALWIAPAIALIAWLPAISQPESEISPRLRDLLKARQFTDAEQVVRGELASSPAWATGHVLLAQIYIQTGKYDLAERCAMTAMRIRESLDAYMALAIATMHLNRFNDSIGWLERTARLSPDHPPIYRLLGLDYTLGGNLREAEKAFRRYTDLDPNDWEGYYFLGRTLFELGIHEESRAALERATRLNNSSAKAWTALGQAQERLSMDAAARRSYEKAVGVCGDGPDCAWPLLQIGFSYTVQSRFADAVPYFRRALEVRPGWARTHFHLAKALIELNDLESACNELERAVELDDGRSEYHYQLAQLYRRLGEKAKAASEFRRFREIAQRDSQNGDTPDFVRP